MPDQGPFKPLTDQEQLELSRKIDHQGRDWAAAQIFIEAAGLRIIQDLGSKPSAKVRDPVVACLREALGRLLRDRLIEFPPLPTCAPSQSPK